jgi:hypothetical protein
MRLVAQPIEVVKVRATSSVRLFMYVVAPNPEMADRRAVSRFRRNGAPRRLSQRVVKQTCDFFLSAGRRGQGEQKLWVYKVLMDRPEGWNAG